MDAYSNRLSQTLQQAIEAEITKTTTLLVSTPVEDYAAYRQRVGYVAGLRAAEGLRQDVERDLGRAEKDKAPEPVKMGRYED